MYKKDGIINGLQSTARIRSCCTVLCPGLMSYCGPCSCVLCREIQKTEDKELTKKLMDQDVTLSTATTAMVRNVR
jgi:hypothetical protein